MSLPERSGLAAASPVFSLQRFFVGRTEGVAALRIGFAPAREVNVHGSGRLEPDGTLVLTQIVERRGKKDERREWRITQVADGLYTGTLTGADGPVAGKARSNSLHLQYRLRKGGLDVEQWLYLQPDTRSVLNRMTVRKMGVLVGTLEETIRQVE